MEKIKRLFLPGEIRGDYADAGDFLRVISVFFVGWFHIWQQSWLNPNIQVGNAVLRFYPLVACGYMFVDLMLLLSGFLLMLGFLSGRSRKVLPFYRARAARILPSYLLCILIMLFAWALPQGLYGTGKHLWIDLLSHLSFTHNLFPESYSYTQLNGALWTLAVEVQFYLLFPLLGRAFEKKPLLTYLGMILVATLSRALIHFTIEDSSIYVNRLSAMMDVYANGMLAAWVYHKMKDLPQRTWAAWLNTLIAVLCMAGIYHILNAQLQVSGGENVRFGQMLRRFPLSLLGGVFLICASRSVALFRKLLTNRPLRFLSGISFNFYIWHQFLAVRLKAWRIPPYSGDTPNFDGQQPWQSQYTFACFVLALAVAIIITYFVEKPCARWLKRERKST